MPILTTEDYCYLYGQIPTNKIPPHIHYKIHNGSPFTKSEEKEILKIINEHKSSGGNDHA